MREDSAAQYRNARDGGVFARLTRKRSNLFYCERSQLECSLSLIGVALGRRLTDRKLPRDRIDVCALAVRQRRQVRLDETFLGLKRHDVIP